MRFVYWLLLAACSKTSTQPTTTTTASSSAPTASAPFFVADASTSSMGIATPDFGPRGPVIVTGYPTKIGTGMDDPAEWAGFTSDGAKVGYCGTFGGIGQLLCATKDASGKLTSEDDRASPTSGDLDAKKTKALKAWIASSGIPHLTHPGTTHEWNPPPIKGDWAFARDIELRVQTLAPVQDKPGTGTPPMVKLGGVLKGEQPVWVVTSTAPTKKFSGTATPYHFTVVNGLQLSPDGSEIGMITHSFCMEYCDDFEIVRIATKKLAAQVYNDTGFRHHEKGEYAKSADLFLLAAFADESNDTYAYNLACALARTSDPRAPAALDLAIARGGEKIKARAKADKDFEAVKNMEWFQSRTK